MQLSPGERAKGDLPDGGLLPRDQVLSTVQLDEITRALDPETREDLSRLLKGLADATEGHAGDLNDALGNVAPFSDDTTELLSLCSTSSTARSGAWSATRAGCSARWGARGRAVGLVRAGDRVLTTTAERNRELADAVRILPTTLTELQVTLDEVRGLAIDAGPVVSELRPAARELADSPTPRRSLPTSRRFRRPRPRSDPLARRAARAHPRSKRTASARTDPRPNTAGSAAGGAVPGEIRQRNRGHVRQPGGKHP